MKKFVKVAAAVAVCTSCVFFTACSKGESYSVNVSPADHGAVYAVQTTAKAGERVRLSCLPQVGYRLAGYKVDGADIEGNTFTMPNGDVQVSAVFDKVTYSITYIDFDGITVDGGALGNPATYTVDDWGAAIASPEIGEYDEGGWYYHFAECDENHYYGYHTDGLENFKAESIAEGTIGNLTLYAHRYNVPHEITTDESLQHGSVWTEPYEATAGEEVYLYYYISDDCYEFVHFTVDGEEIEGDSFTMGHKTVEVSAIFRPIDYSISYELDGGTVAGDNPVTYNAESGKFTLIEPTLDGCEFSGWDCKDEYGYIGVSFYAGEEIDVSLFLGRGNITFEARYNWLD